MGKLPTIADVAKRAGVSKSTVSRFLNEKPVRPDTEKRIREAIEHLGYEANLFARLSAKQSNILGIILPGFDSTVTPRVMTALDRYLRTKGYTPLIINTEGDLSLEVASIGNLDRMNVDGIIIVSTFITPEHREAVARADAPVVFMGQEFSDGISIVDDNFNAGRELGRYAVRHGVSSSGCLWVDERDVAVGQRRRDGVVAGLREGGIEDVPIYTADFTYPTAYAVAKRVLASPDRPQALICATDRIAYGVYKAARELGLSIPDDIAVAGFGGYDTSEVVTPPLTTIRFDVETAACVCADTVLRMFHGEPVSKTQMIGYRLIEGESL